MIRLGITVAVTMIVGFACTVVYLCRDELVKGSAMRIGPRSGM